MSEYIIHFIHSALFFAAVTVFIRSIVFRLKLVQKGQPEKTSSLTTGIRSFILNVLFQEKLFKHPLRGIMHAFIFYGFMVYSVHTLGQMTAGNIWSLLVTAGIDPYGFRLLPEHGLNLLSEGTAALAFSFTALLLIMTFITYKMAHGGNIFQKDRSVGGQWLIISALSAEFLALFFIIFTSGELFYENIIRIFSLLVITGLAYFAFRRWILKSKELDVPSNQSAIVITLIKILMVSTLFGLAANAFIDGTSNPIDVLFINLFQLLGMEEQSSAVIIRNSAWWIHLATVYAFMIYVPTSKHAHLIFAPINFLFIKDAPRGQMPHIDLEDETSVWGAANISELSWKTLLDSLSCIECGRCTLVCPANSTGKPLNPKKIMVDIKHAMIEYAPAIMSHNEEGPAPSPVIGDTYITDEELWGCTTCMACVEACPVGNNQVDAILSMRKNLVLQESRFPSHLQNAFNNMERNSNPWGVASSTRADWCQDLDVKKMAEDSGVDILYWVGCAGAFDERNKNIARSFVKILKKANVNFAILGTEESCTGDSARRGGNEYLYQMLAGQNIELMNGYGVKKIVTTCPHCYNTLKNDYPQLGGNYEVSHHSEFIDELVKKGNLQYSSKNSVLSQKKGAYHDSCYLGRSNDIYNQPRDIVKNSMQSASEPVDSGSNSLCCGAGGSQMWMEEKFEKVNIKRTGQLLATGADVIATACPFCNIMISDGVKASEKSESVKVMDIAEIVAEGLES